MATKVLDRLTVAASPPAPGGVLPLTFFDVPWLFTGPVERVFFYPYPHTAEHFAANLLPQPHLVSSLSAALHRFYPLVGRVRPCPDGGGGYEFYSAGGDAGESVQLTVAESSDDFDELSGCGPRNVARLYALVPQLPRTEDGTFALAAAQVTVFAGRGIAVGVSIHHVACDDSSYMHFVKTWAGQCRVAAAVDSAEAAVPPPPFLDRGVVADPEGLAARTLDEMRQLAANAPPPPSPPPPPTGAPTKLVIASFALTRDRIDRLKQRVLAAAAGERAHCSAFTVACAFAWACLARVDGGGGADTEERRAHLLFSVESGVPAAPPIPQEYLGNCLRPCFVEVGLGDLVGAGGVVAAAAAIGASVRALDDGVLAGAGGWFHKILSLVPERPMSAGGSPRYGVYETDFGLGRPTKVELVSIDKTPGTVSLAEGRDAQGGIEIGVVLPEADMARFSTCFTDGLEQL
ncbi:unnamed protein product [Urochloa humidicola]